MLMSLSLVVGRFAVGAGAAATKAYEQLNEMGHSRFEPARNDHLDFVCGGEGCLQREGFTRLPDGRYRERKMFHVSASSDSDRESV
jgi:hypothetical protein